VLEVAVAIGAEEGVMTVEAEGAAMVAGAGADRDPSKAVIRPSKAVTAPLISPKPVRIRSSFFESASIVRQRVQGWRMRTQGWRKRGETKAKKTKQLKSFKGEGGEARRGRGIYERLFFRQGSSALFFSFPFSFSFSSSCSGRAASPSAVGESLRFAVTAEE